MGKAFFIRGIPLLQPRLYKLGEIKTPPILTYSDAEWTILDKPPWLSKGLGGILWEANQKPWAAAIDTPQHLVDGLSDRKTQIISLELMAAAGMLYTYQDKSRGKDIIFFIDNKSVCCALVKGCSRSADILSRAGTSLYPTQSGKVDALILPPWADVASSRDIKKVFDAI